MQARDACRIGLIPTGNLITRLPENKTVLRRHHAIVMKQAHMASMASMAFTRSGRRRRGLAGFFPIYHHSTTLFTLCSSTGSLLSSFGRDTLRRSDVNGRTNKNCVTAASCMGNVKCCCAAGRKSHAGITAVFVAERSRM